MNSQRSAKSNRARLNIINKLKQFFKASKSTKSKVRTTLNESLENNSNSNALKTFLEHLSQQARSLFGKSRKAQRRMTLRNHLRDRSKKPQWLVKQFLTAIVGGAQNAAPKLSRVGFIENLEERRVLTTTLYLDFGQGLGMGNTLSTNTGAFKNIFGAGDPSFGGSLGTGSDLTSGFGLLSTDSLDMSPLSYDFEGDGDIDSQDITALSSAVVPLIQRALSPFDINVVVVGATSLAQAATIVGSNAGDPTGQFDAYNFVMDIRSNGYGGGSVGDGAPLTADGDRGDGAGLFGIAAADDLEKQIFGGPNTNTQDEATLVFSDTILGSTSGTPGTAAFNRNFAQRLAYTITHESFHTFSAIHTNSLTASGDVIRVGSVTRENPFMVTRFDLNHDNAVAEPNNYLMIAQNPDIGLRDANNNGVPDKAYVTGTGGHDSISLTNLGGGLVQVNVSAFSNAARTTLIRSESYQIALGGDTDGVIEIDAGINSDFITIDGTIPATIIVRGGEGVDGIAAANERDTLAVTGGGRDGQATPVGQEGANISVTGGATIQASEFEPMEFSNFSNFIFTTPNAIDNVALNSAVALGGQNGLRLSGTSGGQAFEQPTFYSINSLQFDLGANDGVGAQDTLVINGGTAPLGIPRVTVGTGAANDLLLINQNLGTFSPSLYFDGGEGFDFFQLLGGAVNNASVSVASLPSSGSVQLDASDSEFVNVESLSLLPNTLSNLGVNPAAASSLDGDNSITYFPASNLIQLDNLSIKSTAPQTLTINSGSGSDTINIGATTATSPTNINIIGGDPTNDTLIINGSSASENVNYTPTSSNTGFFTGIGASTIAFSQIEHLTYDGQGGTDVLSVTSPNQNNTIVVDFGTAADAGKVSVSSTAPISFQNIGSNGAVSLADLGGLDRLIMNGSSGNDNYVVNSGADGVISYQSDVSSSVGGTNHVRTIASSAIEALLLNALDGDDSFVVNPGNAFPTGVAINAGNPSSGSDRVNLNGTAGADNFTLSLGSGGDALNGALAGPLVLNNVEDLTLSTGSGTDSLAVFNMGAETGLKQINYFSGNDALDTVQVTGSTFADTFSITPTFPEIANLIAIGTGTALQASLGAAATSTFTVNGSAASDIVLVNGSGIGESIGIVKGLTTNVSVGSNKTITIDTLSTENVTVDGGDGNDIFNVFRVRPTMVKSSPSLAVPQLERSRIFLT
ncbi:MAG: hypothetical protein U0930_22305 [Pirellulales bacterium]